MRNRIEVNFRRQRYSRLVARLFNGRRKIFGFKYMDSERRGDDQVNGRILRGNQKRKNYSRSPAKSAVQLYPAKRSSIFLVTLYVNRKINLIRNVFFDVCGAL